MSKLEAGPLVFSFVGCVPMPPPIGHRRHAQARLEDPGEMKPVGKAGVLLQDPVSEAFQLAPPGLAWVGRCIILLFLPMHPTPFLEITQISPGEFRRDGTYKNWRPRGTKDWLFIHTVEGSGLYQSRDQEVYRSRPGDCTLYEPGAWQRYDTDPEVGKWRLQWAHFHPLPHWRPWLNWPSPWKGFRTISLAKPGLRQLVETEMGRLIHSFRTKPRLAGDFALQRMGEILLQIQAERLDHPFSQMDERILQAIEIMASHFHEPTSLTRLASTCGLSLSRFAHLFKEQTGMTPQRMLEENRLRHAAHLLLSTGLMVFEIASEVGYESPFYFANRFRRFWGKTPSAFRLAGASGLNSSKRRRS